jgi:hypothetical protein
VVKELILRAEVEKVGTVRCDITLVPRGDLQSRKNYDTDEPYIFAYLTCKMRTCFASLEVTVLVNETTVGYTTIAIGREVPQQSNPFQSGRTGSISSLESGPEVW